MMLRTLFLATALAFGASSAFALDARLATPWERGVQRVDTIQALVADTSLDAAELAEAMASPDWQVRQQAAVVHGWRAYPELYATFDTRQAAPTRAGVLRFRGPELADARLAPLFLERLLQQRDPAYQQALLEVLPRTGGDWAQAFVAMMTTEQSAGARAFMVASLRYGEIEHAAEGIRVGLADADADVRGEAARAAGWHKQGAVLADDLVAVLGDSSAYTRAMAARSLGYLRAASAYDALLPLLRDSDAEVRLQTLHALERLNAADLATRPELDDLAHDADPRVVRAAQSLR